jgi:serine/threonine protein kinase
VHCERHPKAVAHHGHCPACLIEAACASGDTPLDAATREPSAGRVAASRKLTICLPLGANARASVFLVRDEGMSPRLLRLKVWHHPSVPGFLDRFQELQARLEHWRGGPIAWPLAASVDSAGHPAVLSEFRQGVPLLDSLADRTTKAANAWMFMRPVVEAIRSAHAAGLVHGAIVPGNVLVQPGSGTTHLLDFGMAALLDPLAAQGAMLQADRDGLAALARATRRCRRR